MITLKEFFLLHAVYTAIVEMNLGHTIPFPQSVEESLRKKDSTDTEQPASEPLRQWLAVLDLAVNPHHLRSYIVDQNLEEPELVSLLRFLGSKKTHSDDDRDKVDWLATHLLKKREEKRKRPMGWPKAEIQEIFKDFDFPPLSRYAEDLLMEIPSLLDEMKYFNRFPQITDSLIIQRGRDLKNQLGDEFFHPDILTAMVNYNLLFGRKFHELFQEITQKVHEFAQERPETAPPDTKELLQGDYHSTGDAFRHLSDLGRKEAMAPAMGASPAGAAAISVEQQLKNLGIDSAQEALNLRNRTQELAVRLRTNLGITTIPNSFAPLPLQEWESNAFRADYAQNEQTFRAEFSRAVCHAVSILSRTYEEIPLYQEKKGTEYLWKKHYDALVYLLYEGRVHKEALFRLAALSKQRGLLEKAKQLQMTAEKLEAGLRKLAALF